MSETVIAGMQKLLRGEIAAAETYAEVIADRSDPTAETLQELQLDHGAAIRFFYEELGRAGADQPVSSGVWGGFARIMERGSTLLGERAALATLREGERRGILAYTRLFHAPDSSARLRARIANEFLPAQRRHVRVLDGLGARSS